MDSSERDTPAALPSISDYWPDAPHRMGPAPDVVADGTPADEPVRDPFRLVRPGEPAGLPDAGPDDEAAAPRPGRLRALLTGTVAAVLLFGAGTVLAALVRGDERPAPVLAVPAPETSAPPPPAEVVPATVLPQETTPAATTPPPRAESPPPPAAGPGRLTFELTGSLATMTVRTGDVGPDLLSVRTARGVRPGITRGDRTVRLTLTRGGKAVAADAEVILDEDVRWVVRAAGGAKRGVLDLTGGAPAAVELAGGGARIDLLLPGSAGVLPVRVLDGVNELRLHTPAEVPVRFRARAGAGRVDLYGSTRDGVARGGVVTTGPDGAAPPGIDVDATGGLGSLTVATDR